MNPISHDHPVVQIVVVVVCCLPVTDEEGPRAPYVEPYRLESQVGPRSRGHFLESSMSQKTFFV